MTDLREVIVRVYVSAESAETQSEALDFVEDELSWLCTLDNPLLAFTIEEEKDNG
jgi:hypothetical protein